MVADSLDVPYKRGISVKHPLTVFVLAPVGPYSSQVQQPAHTTDILSSHRYTDWAAPMPSEQERADSSHRGGQQLMILI